jgi:hypothetical protein
MCVLRRWNGDKLSRKYAMFISAMISSIPAIIGFNSKEMSLFKLIIFPILWRCVVTKGLEIGVVP